MSLNYTTSIATMTDSLLAPGQEVLYKRCPSQRSLSPIRPPLLLVPRTTRAPSPGEHVQLFRMKPDRNKGFYTEKCSSEACIALYSELARCLVPRDV